MARNAEKAMTTLARWRAAHLDGDQNAKKRRPYLASECSDVKEAERWRLDIIREISKKVTQVQNAGLGEFKIRDLNDQINKLLREKRHWEYRIHELGGTNFKKFHGTRLDRSGKEVPGSRGYKYFGAAKDLPGVRELFAQEPPPLTRKTRAELLKNIDAHYYGYRDEDDGVLLPLEAEAEKVAIRKAFEKDGLPFDFSLLECSENKGASLHDDVDDGLDFVGPQNFISHVPAVPTQNQIQREIVQHKKNLLLQKYVTESMENVTSSSSDLLRTDNEN